MLKVLDALNESQARWYVAREVLARGRGGLKAMYELTGMSRPTILKGIRELRGQKGLPRERVRQPGGGRKRLEESDPGLQTALERIMEENTAGDPMSWLRWTNKSTVRIAEELTRLGHSVSDETVRRRLADMGYSLQANVKNLEESAAGRDRQFRYINRQVKQFLARQEPVLSVDTKKKERVGNFKNAGKAWRPKGQPMEVNVYDFPHLGVGPAIPYGAYDQQRNEGFVNVGISYDTVINLIGATRTATGLRVKAKLDTRYYEAGVKISDEEMKQISLRTHSTNPEWNYTISPRGRTI